MKISPSYFLMLTAILLSLFTASCGKSKERVKTQANEINFQHQMVINGLEALERSLESYIPSIMDKAYQDAVDRLDSAFIIVKALTPARKDEEDLRDDALLLFDTYRLLVENEYSEIVRRQKKPAGTFTAGDEFLVQNLGKHIAVNRKKAKEKFESEAVRVLKIYKLPFEPVGEESPDSTVSKTRGLKEPKQ